MDTTNQDAGIWPPSNKKILTFDKMSHDMIIGMDILQPMIETIGLDKIFNQKDKRNRSKSEITQISISKELEKN